MAPRQPSASEEGASPYPKMSLCQRMHRLTRESEDLPAVFEEIADELQNPTLYRTLRTTIYDGMEVNVSAAKLTEEQLKDMENKNNKTMQELEEKVEEAALNAGDMEVLDARQQIARFAAKALDKQAALQAYQKIIDLPKLSSGKKIDAYMEAARVASFHHDTTTADIMIDKANKLANEGSGGDWDRRNRLKVYRALQRLLHRDFQEAANLLLDCIATFSCNEMCTYTEFVVYAILTNILYLPRPELKEKIIDGPEILSVAVEIPVVNRLINAYYQCEYKAYLHAMVDLEKIILGDRFLQPHAQHWMRELHLLAYKQFLDSYQSVTLQAMADAFGVSVDFIDHYASGFIADNRLSAKIDKFGGVIHTNRPDLKNAQYRDMIQKGDALLNRIQKLARVLDL